MDCSKARARISASRGATVSIVLGSPHSVGRLLKNTDSPSQGWQSKKNQKKRTRTDREEHISERVTPRTEDLMVLPERTDGGIGLSGESSAMLPAMAKKPRIAILGPGHLGTSLAMALNRAGFAIEAIIGKADGKSGQRARKLAKQVGARASDDFEADVVWFCVPDAEITPAALAFAGRLSWEKKVALHSSGALTSDSLQVLRRKGADVASVHPLMTFANGSRVSFAGVPFAIEGDAAAVRAAKEITRSLGGKAYSVRKQDKAAYHAWGTFASPLLTALLATTEDVAGLAGVKSNEAKRRMLPILRQTLSNYAALGAAAGFSGPIIRGDIETVCKHLRVLRNARAAREVYLALARAALRYLPAKNKKALKTVLSCKA